MITVKAICSIGWRANIYYAHHKAMAWRAAGWKVEEEPDFFWAHGPHSIKTSIDLDILELTGCLDAPCQEVPA